MNEFSHFKKSRKKGIIKGCFYSLLVIALIYVSFSDVLASKIFPLHSEIILQSNQGIDEKLDLFFNSIRVLLIFLFGYGIFRSWRDIKYKCKEYDLWGDFVDSLDQEKIVNNYTSFTEDLNNVLVGQNAKNQSDSTKNIQGLLDGSLNKEIVVSYQTYILSSTLLIAFPIIILIKIIGS